ncbi:uncharacterized protein PFL1_01691 [Pseudozyma flocculosa PF-1]|uniref:Uncharacterized protein n=1 Tax=Pseudozyma flocculosa TaxID=84751 RepID=A0A5C3EZK2_9BASI|nr:uncharacterized protein PFL1_01691 [Pseudozyma flocculosa PF-1]EPQ30790.1 hypothetical protein PFL1_01691 [Pseudozyma flocculosa PF-1]SPO36847.1 uncharacterized protein PSFLO_02318 [Pseudozyma flocculosa]
MTPYKGSLRYKRKSDIVDIATALDLHPNPNSFRREDLEELVREHLIQNKHTYANDQNFKGLIDSLDQEQKRRRSARSSSINPNIDSDDTSDSPDHAGIAKTPRKHSQRPSTSSLLATPSSTPASASAAAAAADLGASVHSSGIKAKKSLERLVESVSGTAQSAAGELTANPHVQEARQEATAAVEKVQKRAKKTYRDAKKRAYHVFVDVRTWLSDSRHLVVVLLALEAIALVLSALPTTFVEVGSRGPTIPIIHPNRGINGYLPHYALTVPNPRGLISLAFWQPVVLWTLYGVLIPGAVAHLVTFDRKSHPSALSFLLARVSALVLLTHVIPRSVLASLSAQTPAVLGVAAGETPEGHHLLANAARSFLSYGHVLDHLGHDLQLWASATALGFAVYEGLATRPRSV